jgi:hypothetical protein
VQYRLHMTKQRTPKNFHKQEALGEIMPMGPVTLRFSHAIIDRGEQASDVFLAFVSFLCFAALQVFIDFKIT